MLLISSIYLVVSSLKCKEDSYRPKYTTSFFYSLSKETTHKPLKVAATKNFSSSVHVVDTTCFDECFLSHLITESHCFFQKSVVTLRFLQLPYCSCLWNKCFERSPCFTLSPQYQCSANTKVSKQSYLTLYLTKLS